MSLFRGRVGFVQRLVAPYRVPLIDRLAARCTDGLEVFAGMPMFEEAVGFTQELDTATLTRAQNIHIGKEKTYFCWQRGLFDWLREYDPDVLFVPATPRLPGTWLASYLMHRRGRPVVAGGLGLMSWPGVPRIFERARIALLRSYYRSFDALVSYGSKSTRDYVSAGVPEDRVFTAYNAVDSSESDHWLKTLGRDSTLVSNWRKKIGLDASLPTLIYVGRIVKMKRLDLLIDAWRPFADRSQLLIVGDGPSRTEYEKLSESLGARVKFMGHQKGKDLACSLLASDVYVLPGSGGLGMHQAMSYGKPIIASLGGGDWTEADLVREGENGILFEQGNLSTLRCAISTLLFNPEMIARMGEGSRRIVREEINMERLVDVYLHAFRTVTNQIRVN